MLVAYVTWMTLLVVAYYGLPRLRAEAWGLIGLTGVSAIVAGVVINRPARKAPWLLLAGANLSFIAGQVSFLVLTQIEAAKVPFPSFADVLYLLTYPLYAAGLLIFIWWRTPDRDRRSLIDALTLTVGLALLSWIYLILPYVHNPALSWLQKSVAIAYPLGDVLVLAMLARLLAPGTARTRSVQLLTLGSAALLVSDVSFGLILLYGTFRNGTIVDLGWAVFYAAWGAAALHPTMSELTQPVSRQQAETSPIRLTVLMLASFIAPAVLFIQSLRGQYRDDSVIAVFSAILFLLVLSRLWDVAASHRRALGRERAVRLAGASLASAATVEEAALAVRSAAATLVGPRSRREALLMVRDDGTLRPVAAGDGTGPLGDPASTWMPLLAGSVPLYVPAVKLGAQGRTLLADEGGVLLCPLTLRDRPSGDPLIGVLAVFGEQRILADLSGTFEVLAHQVALAVERVTLSQEVIRQRSEAYFRTLVQDTSDVILIVGDDGAVRYATPSAMSIFGDVSVEGRYLWDLVTDGGRDDVIRALTRMRRYVGNTSGYEDWQIARRDGRSVQVQVRCSDLRGDSTVRGLVLTLRDVTEQRQLEDELKYRAFHDALTGLPNRLLFQDRAAHALARAKRDGTTIGVLFVDLDDFKVTNDTMGHSVGDELLAAAGMRLSAMVRESDTAARLGGDEFALLIERFTDPAAVEAFAERVVRAFSEPFALADGSVHHHGHGRRSHHRRQRRPGRAAPSRGPGAVRGQDGRQTAVAALPAGPQRRDDPAAGGTGRAGRGGERLRVHPRLSAHRGPDQRRNRRVRGPGAMAASAVGHDAARPIHRAGRGDRPHRPPRLLGARAGRRTGRPVAATATARDIAVRERERLGSPVPRPRLRRRRAGRARGVGPGVLGADA